MALHTYLSIITLNVNGLNAPTKRHRGAEWIKKQDPYICCLQEAHLRLKGTHRLKAKGWKKIFHANGKEKKAEVAIIISNKIDFKTKAIVKDKEGHYIMIKGTIQQEDITLVVNIYAPNIGVTNYVKQILMDIKGEIDSNTVTAGDFNTPLTSKDRSSRQKINKETVALNDTVDHKGQTQGPWAKSGPPPCFIWPGNLFLPGSSVELSLNLSLIHISEPTRQAS